MTVPVAVVVVVVGRTSVNVIHTTLLPLIVVEGYVTVVLPLVRTQFVTNVSPMNSDTPLKVVPAENTGADDNTSDVEVILLAVTKAGSDTVYTPPVTTVPKLMD